MLQAVMWQSPTGTQCRCRTWRESLDGQWEQDVPLFGQSDRWLVTGGTVNALMGHVLQPVADMRIGRSNIQLDRKSVV